MKYLFALLLILGLSTSSFARHGETFSEITPDYNQTLIIDLDTMVNYEMRIKFIHSGEELKLPPMQIWKRLTQRKEKVMSHDELEEIAEESARKTDEYFKNVCDHWNHVLSDKPDYCKFVK